MFASDEFTRVAQAARLEPGNSRYWLRLGLIEEWDPERRNPAQAAVYFRRAIQADPWSNEPRWDLAAVLEAEGDFARAETLYQEALTNQMNSPEAAWRYGSFLLRQGKVAGGFEQIQRALALEPSLEPNALSECWEADPDISAILRDALPRNATAYLSALNYFVSQKNTDAALAAWDQLLTLRESLSMAESLPLVDGLIDEDRIDEAQKVWDQSLASSNRRRTRDASDSLVFNGGFESDSMNGGFDWRELPAAGVNYDYDSEIAHSGKRSLRITFSGNDNTNFQQVFQNVAVQPGHHYSFAAFLRTENITTKSGVRFELLDPHHLSESPIFTPQLIGTNAWMRVRADVKTSSRTHLLEILLRRTPGAEFDNKIRGTVWIDDVSLIPDEPTAKDSKR
jgi:Flp pilus assembly protein TadD